MSERPIRIDWNSAKVTMCPKCNKAYGVRDKYGIFQLPECPHKRVAKDPERPDQ